MIESLKLLNQIGVWTIGSFILGLTAWLLGLKILFFSQKRAKNIDFCFYLQTYPDHYAKRLYILVRNNSTNNIIISSSYITLKNRLFASQGADGNSSTNEFVLKFPIPEGNGFNFKETLTMLKPGEQTNTFLPLDNKIDLEKLAHDSNKKIGYLKCCITLLTEKPIVVRCKMPLVNIQNRINP